MKNNNENYLIHNRKFQKAYNFLNKINYPAIVALEGKCGSGKTTLANNLKNILNLTVIPTDDFFLSPQLKTKARLMEIGGNIDYKRIYDLLTKIKSGKVNTYKKYDCKSDIFI